MAKIYVTKEGYQKLTDDLHHLVTVENKQALEMLKDARDKGDIAENGEYETAKEYHENLSNKIATLQDKIKKCEIIYPDIKSDKVNMLSSVEIKNYNDPQNIDWFKKHGIRNVPCLVVEDDTTFEIIQGIDDIIEKIKQGE